MRAILQHNFGSAETLYLGETPNPIPKANEIVVGVKASALNRADISQREGKYPPPKGESIKMVEERVFPFCTELIERIKHNNINVAISAHSNSMRAIRRYFEKLSIVEEITLENPLGCDYSQYVVHNQNNTEAAPYFTRKDLDDLIVPNESLFEALDD